MNMHLEICVLFVMCLSAYGTPIARKPNIQFSKLFMKESPTRMDLDFLELLPNSHNEVQQYTKTDKASASVTCFLCKEAMNLALWRYYTPDKKYPGLFKFVISMCTELKIEPPDVCTGIVNAMKNETQYLLKNVDVNGEMICGLIFPTTCTTLDLSWNRDKWIIPTSNISSNKSTSTKLWTNKNKKWYKMKVLHVSDLHIDLKYKPGSVVDCKEPLCCREDLTNEGQAKAGYWGSYGFCDTPYWTVENFLQTASKQNFDYILWTGDLPAHNIWNQSREGQLYLLKNLTALLLKYFPSTPIYPALGNHESFPVNSFPPTYVKNDNSISWLYEGLVEAWSPWLPKDALETVGQSGFYAVLVHSGLRLISLNMNYCNNQNYWMLINPVDPNGELSWLEKTLNVAELNNEKVQIIGHIPPSIGGDCLKVWRNNYYDIVTRFRHIITGQFFGHTHKDEFEILYKNSTLTQPVSMAYIAPSITTFSDLNPGYRVYDMNSSDGSVLDHHTYILNLTAANLPHSTPIWKLEYSAKQAYNLATLSVNDWHNLYQNWMKSQSTTDLFEKYYLYYYKGHPPKAVCNEACKKGLLCSIAAGNFTVSCNG